MEWQTDFENAPINKPMIFWIDSVVNTWAKGLTSGYLMKDPKTGYTMLCMDKGGKIEVRYVLAYAIVEKPKIELDASFDFISQFVESIQLTEQAKK